MNIRVKSLAVPLAFLVLAAGSAARSEEVLDETRVQAQQVVTQSVRVGFGDLDLGSTTGREVLHARLKQAARNVCDHHGFVRSGSLSYHAETRACYEESLAAALAQVESGQLVMMN